MNGYPPSAVVVFLRSTRHFLLIATMLIVGALLLFSPHAAKAAEESATGNLLIQAKGEVEVYHNGRKIVLRDKADANQHYRVKVPGRPFKAGDTVVLSIRSPYVYRAIVVAIDLSGKGGQIPVKKSDWRLLGENKDASKITAAEIQGSQETPTPGTPDPSGDEERKKLGILPEAKGGSEWVKTAKQLNSTYCIGFVLTAEMMKAPIKE